MYGEVEFGAKEEGTVHIYFYLTSKIRPYYFILDF